MNNWLECEISCTKIMKEMYEKFAKGNRWAFLLQVCLATIVGIIMFSTDFAVHPIAKMIQCVCFGTFITNIFHHLIESHWNKRDLKSSKRKLVYLENRLAEVRYAEQLERSKVTSELTKRLNDIYPENKQPELKSQSAEM